MLFVINGVPFGDLLSGARKSGNNCVSCGEMLGAPTCCRVLI